MVHAFLLLQDQDLAQIPIPILILAAQAVLALIRTLIHLVTVIQTLRHNALQDFRRVVA